MSKYWAVQPYNMYILLHFEKKMCLILSKLIIIALYFWEKITRIEKKIAFLQFGKYALTAPIMEGKKARELSDLLIAENFFCFSYKTSVCSSLQVVFRLRMDYKQLKETLNNVSTRLDT